MMCLDGEKLLDLCELYPNTAKNVKYRSLDRRMYYLKHQQIQQRELRSNKVVASNAMSEKVKTVDIEMLNPNSKKSVQDDDEISFDSTEHDPEDP